MAQTTVVIGIAAIILFIINIKKTGKQFEGIKSGLNQFIKIAPVIIEFFGRLWKCIQENCKNWLSKERV